MSTADTEGIRVTVEVKPLPERTSLAAGQFAYGYTVTIRNGSAEPVQLMSRHWVITDATGHVEEVRGPGVVGRQPNLRPGESFEYSSWVALKTPFGSMRGTYHMVRPNGRGFDARIAEFALVPPHGRQ